MRCGAEQDRCWNNITYQYNNYNSQEKKKKQGIADQYKSPTG